MKLVSALVAVVVALAPVRAAVGTSLLFIGNSFTYGAGSPVMFYRAETVTDLNHEGIGGVPALVKSFADQAGLDYDVALETRGGSGLEFHLQDKLGVIGRRPWDQVVMHGQSTLDFDAPGDPAKLIRTAVQMAEFLRGRNPRVQLFLTATWSRADQTYPSDGAWAGKPIAQMARDVRAAYDKAAAASGAARVIPVGDAWNRAMAAGVADANPYDGLEPGKIDLWTHDHYHASAYGYYLEALVVFGSVTGHDPRSLGEQECSGYELGFTQPQVKALQQVAFDELAAAGTVSASPLAVPASTARVRCGGAR
ncbi:MAG: PEP-CTERM sorting domain-containing protein [Acidobacteria bacterium]|nr:PEP-CTERM sorting domain-containing protein [Acidobacteriota bacterium]